MQPKFCLQGINISVFSILREDVVKKACPVSLIFLKLLALEFQKCDRYGQIRHAGNFTVKCELHHQCIFMG